MLGKVLKRAGWLGVGTAAGQAVVLAATPFLARVFDPAQFGVFALLITAGNIATAIGSARFDFGLPSAADEEVPGLVRICLIVSATLALAVAAASLALHLLVPMRGAGASVLAQPVLLGLCVFFAATFQSASSLLLRQERVGEMAVLRAAQGVIFAGLALGTPLGLLWSHALSFALGLIFLPASLRAPGLPMRVVAARYRQFAALGLPGATLDVVGYSLCIWIVTSIYGAAASGEFSQVQRIIGAPLMLASISLGQILLRQTAEHADDRPAVRTLLLRVMALMVAGGLGAILFLALYGAPLLRLVLGAKWNIDTITIVSIAIAVLVRATVSPISGVLATYRRFDLALRWQILYFCSAICLFSLFCHLLPFSIFPIFYAVHEVILYAVYLYIISIALRN